MSIKLILITIRTIKRRFGESKRTFFAFIIILLSISSITSGQDQNNTGIVDSTDLLKKRTEAYLKKLLEESTTKVKNASNSFEDIEIDELIVNSMISKSGNDFFDYFISGFEWPKTNGSFIVLISEKPFRTNTTQIVIMVNDLEVFRNVLQPRTSYLEELANYAQSITSQYIINYQQIMRDIEGDDRFGTGIY